MNVAAGRTSQIAASVPSRPNEASAPGDLSVRSVGAHQNPPVVSVIGDSNVGKTTLLEKLVPELSQRGLRVGVIKYHHRPVLFDLAEKDTYRLAEAGAFRVVGASPSQVAVFEPRERLDPLDELVRQYLDDADFVLTEGHKSGPYPKLELRRATERRPPLCDPRELLAYISDEVLLGTDGGESHAGVPEFLTEDVPAIANFLKQWIVDGATAGNRGMGGHM